ncbi:MAG: hypothetical protein ACJ8CR_30630 [Roseiflexaceae bacterium]
MMGELAGQLGLPHAAHASGRGDETVVVPAFKVAASACKSCWRPTNSGLTLSGMREPGGSGAGSGMASSGRRSSSCWACLGSIAGRGCG